MMPNPLNRRTGGQWDTCSRCDRLFPVGELINQKGVLVCRGDFDDVTREDGVRQRMIEEILGVGANDEGSDKREVDTAFFAVSDELES